MIRRLVRLFDNFCEDRKEISDIKTESMWLMKGDCLERMKEIESGSADIVLTDPPYGMNLSPQRKTGKYHGVKIKNDDNLDWSSDFFDECYRILPRNSCAFVFCNHHCIA